MRLGRRLGGAIAALAATIALASGGPAAGETVLRVVKYADLRITDPIWSTAYISRDFGYMVYDTLFALDERLQPQPQMVERWEVSGDRLRYDFTLREGLRWHDGGPVTAEDAIASLRRWAQRDSMGRKLMGFVAEMTAADERRFTMRLSEPYGLVLASLAKPSANVPFIMPKRVAATPADEQARDYTGSGPFRFKADEWRPGDKAVFVRNPDYVPRAEPPTGAAGGKVVRIDRIEWRSIPDHLTAVNALIAGEIDLIESPPHDLYPTLEAAKDVELSVVNALGHQYMFRMNHLHPPFDNPKVRQAALAALNQEDFLRAVIGNPKYYKTCSAMFICDTPFAVDAGPMLMRSDFARSRELLAEAGYDGTPVVLLHSTDVQMMANLAPVAASLLRRGGFKVDVLSMDWSALVARRTKRDPPARGGWNAFVSSWTAADVLNPIAAAPVSAACERAWIGWPCDRKLEDLRDAFAREPDLERQRALARDIQAQALEVGTHGHLGQWYSASAVRKDRVTGLLAGPALFLWNVSKR